MSHSEVILGYFFLAFVAISQSATQHIEMPFGGQRTYFQHQLAERLARLGSINAPVAQRSSTQKFWGFGAVPEGIFIRRRCFSQMKHFPNRSLCCSLFPVAIVRTCGRNGNIQLAGLRTAGFQDSAAPRNAHSEIQGQSSKRSIDISFKFDAPTNASEARR